MAVTKLQPTKDEIVVPLTSPTVAFDSYENSKDCSLMSILGRPGHGKTTVGLSLSEKFDINGKDQTLDDIFVITNEKGALDCVKHCVKSIPYWINLTKYTDQGQGVYEKMETEALRMARTYVKEGRVKGVLYDNASTRDKILAAYLSKTHTGWPLINQLLMKQRDFVMEQLISIPAPVIVTFHTRPVGDMSPVEKESAGLDPGDREVIDLVGRQAASFYRGQGEVVPMFRTRNPKGDKFALYPQGINGMEGKVRLKQHDVSEFEPNLHKWFFA